MSEYVKEREHYHDLAVKINRTIGVFYDSLDYIIETYVSPWLSKGFDDDALLDIAKYCFTSNVKTLQGMNLTVMHFYKEGCITSESIRDYIDRQIQNDEFIKKYCRLPGQTGSFRKTTANITASGAPNGACPTTLFCTPRNLPQTAASPCNLSISNLQSGTTRT